MYQTHDQAGRADNKRVRGNGFVARTLRRVGVLAVALLPGAAWAAITPTSVTLPGDIGMGMAAQIQVNWTRTSTPGVGDYFTTVLPAQIDLAPTPLPAGCSYDGGTRTVTCVVPDGGLGASGTVTLDVVGVVTGASNVTITGNSGNTASGSFSVRNSGDLTVGKVKSSPAGDAVAGSPVSFVLSPNIAAGGNDVLAGSSIVVTDQLPGTSAQFNLTGRTFSGPLSPSCNTVANANSTRTLTCTYSGAFTLAQLNASTITVTGTQLANGTFTNIASIASGDSTYVDRVAGNNSTQVNYNALPGTDLQAQGTFPSSYQQTGASQSLVLTYRNNGPLQAATGGTIQTIVPAGFVLGALPAGCVNSGAGTLEGISGTLITCTAGVVNNGSTQSFTLPLTMPSSSAAGNFPVVVTPPAGMTDSNSGNNSILLPYQVAEPFADLDVNKSKSPGSGPIPAGTVITTTLAVVNASTSLSAAAYDDTNPLRVVDDMRPEEIAGGTLSNVTAGWGCTVNPGQGVAPRTTRVICQTNNGAGSLAVGASRTVSFQTTVAAVVGQLELSNRACAGASALTMLGLAAANGPQPADPFTSNDCETTGTDLIVTDVESTNAAVNIVKESSVDGVTWVDPVGSAPTLLATDNDMAWRITITTPAGAPQAIIPTLNLTDTLPGILNVTGAGGAPAHNFVTPAVAVAISAGGYASHNCPATIAAGSSNLACAFTNVAPGANIVVTLSVQRPLTFGTLTNTATLTSPNAVLSGTMSDAAAVVVTERHDLAMTSKTVTPTEPKVGEIVTFALGAQNIGQADVPVGNFTIVDDLHTGTATTTVIAYEFISASGTGMNCTTSAQPGNITRVSCVNTTAVPRWNVRTITIQARIKKPTGALGNAGDTLYTGASNTAQVNLSGGLCEYRLETTTAPVSTSAGCNDAASTSNNTKAVTFNVKVPAIDLQQGKVAVFPNAQTQFRLGDTLRYRFSVRNAGPSRAEEIVMTDILSPIPVGFTFTLNGTTPVANNTGTADGGYSFVARTVTCSQAGANANVVCHLAPALANSWLDAGQMVNFDLEFTMTGTATGPVVFGDRAYVCADETNTYESSGMCDPTPAQAGNNLAALNNTIFPTADLRVDKNTVTAGPVNVGQPVEYRIVLTNNGTATVEKMRLVDTLPSAFEWVSTGAQAPTAVASAGATLSGALAVSATVPANGTDNMCFISNGITSVTAATQRQAITCDVGGNFPANGQVTITLWARPKSGVYDGSVNAPYLTNRINDAQVQPGRDGDGNEVSVDSDPANNDDASSVQVQNSSIAGRVFHDRNDNGDQDGTGPSNDHGLSGVTLTLSGTDIYGNAVSRTVTTNAAGDYVFNNLPPSDTAGYSIVETQPAGYDSGIPQPNILRPNRNGASSAGVTPAAGGYTASNAAGTSTIGGIVLAGGATGVEFDFPEFESKTLSGYVYVDLNNNQVRNAGTDTAISGAVIELLEWDGAQYVPVLNGGTPVTANTDGSGFYQFTGLSPGKTYALREVLPTPPVGTTYVNQPLAVNPGQINGVACSAAVCVPQTGAGSDAATTDRITGIVLAAGNGTQFNFGEVMRATIGGRVYLDRDDDGDYAAGDAPIGGVTIVIEEETAPGVWTQVHTQTTVAADGTYEWDEAIAGRNYRITETQPTGLTNGQENGTASATPNVVTINNLPTTGSTGNDFGELAGSIAGRVWLDLNNNGVIDGAEVGIAGVSVSLPAGTLDALGNPVASVTTDINGNYRFDDLLAGTYVVTEQPAQPVVTVGGSPVTTLNGHTVAGTIGGAPTGTATGVATTPSAVSGIALGAGQHSIANNFGETLPVSVSGTVFFDTDNNGTQNNAADVGIGGVDVVLTGIDDLGNTIAPITIHTAADGSFSFTGLRPGTYTLTEPTQPAGTQNGITTAGTVSGASSGTATPITTTPSVIATINLTTPGSASINNLFGEIPLGSSIVGKVWMDANDDGVIGAGEAGIGGVTVTLSGTDIAGNPVTRTTTTLADGSYSFTNLAPGTYTVTEPNQPAGTGNGETVAGSTGGTATPKVTTPSAITSIPLAANQHSVNNNFGEIPQNSSISGRVWLDLDNDGVVDPGEEGIAGVTVRLSGTDMAGNPVSIDVVTDAQGRYSFEGLSPGTYTVTEPTQPANTFNGQTVPGSTGGTGTPVSDPVSAISTIVLGVGQHSTNNNFGEIQSASIAGRVYNDSDDDGVVDPDETGIPGVEVVLTGTDDLGNPVHLTTTTDANGNYRFEGLRPGTYKVTEPTQPTDTINGETTPGSSGGTATPKTTTPSAIDGIVLKPGEASVNNNFGEIGDSPDMLVSKSVTPATLVTGNPATYTLVVRNGGKRDSSGDYVVQDRLPEGVVLTGTPAGQGWVCTGVAGDVRFSCTSSTVLAAGETSAAVISAPVKVVGATAGTVHNAVLVEGGGEYDFRKPTPEERDAFENNVPKLPVCDPAVTQNACQLPSEVVLAWPNVVVSKSADSPVFTVGMPANYLIRVRNIGERVTDAGYTVEDRLPPGIVLAGTPSGDGWTCTNGRGDSSFQCRSERALAADETHPGTIKVPVEVRPEALERGTVNNAVLVSGGGEPSDRQPTQDERTKFEQHPDTLDECDPAISQNVCRVPNEVQLPTEPTVLSIAKRGDRSVVEIGDSLLYTIDIRHVSGAGLYQVDVSDRLPRGFTYIDGSARVDGGAILDPQGKPGPTLVFDVGALLIHGQKTLTYRVRVGVGAAQGDGINRAQAHGCQSDHCVDPSTGAPLPGSTPSNHAEYRVRVSGGVFTDEACVLGKVFVDCNLNHVQDQEELGIPGVRLYFSDGTWVISDSEGKYSYCGLPPRSHTLKVDPSTLPVGSRLTTSSNRNLGDADSLFLDLKNGELHRADFVEGSCSNPVLEQVKARRTQGEVRAPETEPGQSQLRFESKPFRAPQQATDSANQRPIVEPRANPPSASASQEVQP